jgi:hypothetical protein
MRGSAALLVGALVLLFAAACGGGGGDTRLSREEFESQANAICAKYQKQLNAVGTPSSVGEIPDFVEQALAILNKEVAEIAALSPPADMQTDFDALIQASNNTKAAANDLSQAAKDGDQAAVQKALDEGNAASKKADQIATQLGLDSCKG